MGPDAGAFNLSLYDSEPPVKTSPNSLRLSGEVPQCTLVCVTELAPEMLHSLDGLRRAYVQEMRDAGVRIIDAQPIFRRERGDYYGTRDLRPNALAQDLLANRLAPSIERSFALERE